MIQQSDIVDNAAERSEVTQEENERLTPRALAAEELLKRRLARRDFRTWCMSVGHIPAKHHDLIIRKLQEVTDSPVSKFVMILLPPGSAKSTYTSMDFPPWYLGRKLSSECPAKSKEPAILACSFNKDKAEHFGRIGRNYVAQYPFVLGYELQKDSKAVGEWETTKGGRYFCAGVGTGIAGYRFDLGLIDDYLGSQQDADSKSIRDTHWDWFLGDFYPRMKPNGSIVIIANRRHEQDLVGLLLDPDKENKLCSPIPPERWEVIKLPFFAKENDVLGRSVGERIWPEWFTEDQAKAVAKMPPRIRAGLYDQEPSPEEGDYFKRDNLVGYSLDDLPKDLRIYAAGDFACSVEEGSNRTCYIPGGVDAYGTLWILPDIWWKIADTGEMVNAWLALLERRNPLAFIAEKGHISKSIGPFMKRQMLEQRIFGNIIEVTPARAKDVRARPAQGMTDLKLVRFPKFASWWSDAEHELLTFPGGKSDDFVDTFAHLCSYVNNMTKASLPRTLPSSLPPAWSPTGKWLLDSYRRQQQSTAARYEGR